MTTWKTATMWGFSFKYPAQWSVRLDPESGDQGKYSNYQIVDGTGTPIADFTPNSAADTDGDAGVYTYTDLQRIPVPQLDYRPTMVLFEHMDIDQPAGQEEYERQLARLSVRDVAQVGQRGNHPSLPYFHAAQGIMPWFSTTDPFFNKGMDPRAITAAEAKSFMSTERYRAMKQLMQSLRYDG